MNPIKTHTREYLERLIATLEAMPVDAIERLSEVLYRAYVDGKLEGIVHYLFHRSTWTDGNYCYLQDLFVAEGGRNHGLGRALIEAVYGQAREAGASRVYWLTHESNATARALYDRVADRPGFIQYRRIL